MNYRNIAKNTAYAFAAQGLSFCLSIVQSLVVPKALGVEEFSYWQLFTFYAGYVGFFHLGLNDGVYLAFGGTPRERIDKRSAASQFAFAVAFQSAFSALVLASVAAGGFGPRRGFVVASTAVYLVVQNAASYLMFLLQAMDETKASSKSTMVNRISYLVPLVSFLTLGVSSFEPFVAAYIASVALQLAYCVWCCRDVLSAGFLPAGRTVSESLASIRIGSKLMLANIASSLVLGILRAAMDARWGIEAFGRLSLSISMANFFLAFVSQAAMVLFPALRQGSDDEVRSFFRFSCGALGLAFPAVYLLYFPMVRALGLWLPAYAESLGYLVWLLPVCVFDSKMSIACTTLFKVRREEGLLLRINAATAAAAAAMILASVYLAGSAELAIASATVAIAGRSIASERILAGRLGVEPDGIAPWEAGLTAAFVALSLAAPAWVAMCAYAVLYGVFLAVHSGRLRGIIASVRAKIG